MNFTTKTCKYFTVAPCLCNLCATCDTLQGFPHALSCLGSRRPCCQRQRHGIVAAASQHSEQGGNGVATSSASISEQQQLPSLLELVSAYGARLTTAAQMVWGQVGAQNSSNRSVQRKDNGQHNAGRHHPVSKYVLLGAIAHSLKQSHHRTALQQCKFQSEIAHTHEKHQSSPL